MPEHFADRLHAAIEDKGAPVCVGLDPVHRRLPKKLRTEVQDEVEETESINIFCMDVIQAVAPHVPAVKIQSAFFERYGTTGVDLYHLLVDFARQAGLIVIGDVKRGDIGSTAEAYALGHLKPADTAYGPVDDNPDAVTVNGYFGADGVKPFVDAARDLGKGVFVLVRTSNPSAAAIQDFADADGKKLCEHVAEQVAAVGSGDELLGECGYSCVGAVVAATCPQDARRLREIMPRQIFLVPGYGAQGATAADAVAGAGGDGGGLLINASRSVIYAYESGDRARGDWRQAVADAAKAFAGDVRRALGR